VYRITPETGLIDREHRGTKIPNPRPVDELRTRWGINGITAGTLGVWVIGDPSDERMWRVDHGLRTVRLGFPPSAVAEGDGSVWVADQLGDRLVRIDPTTGDVTKTIRVGREPMAVVVARSGVWVANAIDGTVWRIDPRDDGVKDKVHVGFSPTALAAESNRIWVAGNGS
jgi:YVTN family beta-propeller protein